LISVEAAQRLLSGKITFMSIGRSGFGKQTESINFDAIMASYFDRALQLLRRAGIDVSERIAMTTSATAGAIDMGVRRAAALHGIPMVAFINDGLMPHVARDDPFLPATVHTGGDDAEYSKTSIGLADIVLALPGGAFSLYSDIPQALRLGKDIALVYDESVSESAVSIQNGSVRLGNHVVGLVKEKRRLTRAMRATGLKGSETEIWDPAYEHAASVNAFLRSRPETHIAKLSAKMTELGSPMTPQEIWQKLTIIDKPEQWATLLLRKLGITDDLEVLIRRNTADPITDAAAIFAGVPIVLSMAGRSQMANKASGGAEMRMLEGMLHGFVASLTDTHGRGYRETGIVHGMSDYGSDAYFVNALLERGFPGLGIVKPEWSGFIDDGTKGRSSYVFTEDTYDGFSAGYVGNGLGFRSDGLVVFEGNAGVKRHILEALRSDIPVAIVPLTDDPLYANFHDLQKGIVVPDRLNNVGKWVLASERRKALPHFFVRIRELTGTTVNLVDPKASLRMMVGRLRASSKAPTDDEAKTRASHALYLVGECLDMLDFSTTIDANPGIFSVRSGAELAAFREALWLGKSLATMPAVEEA
jgi:hypothetical protein